MRSTRGNSMSTPSRSRAIMMTAVLFAPTALLSLGGSAAIAVPPASLPIVEQTSALAVVATPDLYAQTGGYFLQDGVVDQQRNILYVADPTSDPSTVVSMDLATGRATAIPLGGGYPATDVAVSPLDGTVYVTHNTNAAPSVSVVDPDVSYSAASLPPQIPVAIDHPQRIEVGNDGRVFVAHFDPQGISVLGASNGPDRMNVVQTIPGAGSGGGFTAMDSTNELLYYVSDRDRSVTVLDVGADPAIIVGEFGIAQVPLAAAFDPVRKQLALTFDDNTVSWFAPASDWTTAAVTRTETLAASPAGATSYSPYSLGFLPDGTALAVHEVWPDAMHSYVSAVPPVVSTATPVRSIEVGSTGFSVITDNRAGGTAYVTNAGRGTVSTITGVTLTGYSSTHEAGTDGIATARVTRADGRPFVGTVVFTDSAGVSISASTDSSGLATAVASGLPVGSADFDLTITSPAGIALGARSTVVTQPVTVATSATTLSVSRPTVDETEPVEATVKVTLASGTATGPVTVTDGAGTVLASDSLVAGSTTLRIAALPLGTTTLTARFAGGAGISGSVSAPITVTVVASTPEIIPSTARAVPGGQLVIDLDGFMPFENVVVTIYSDPVVLGTVRMDGAGAGRLVTTVPNIDAGAHRIVAVGASSGRTVESPFTVVAAIGAVSVADAPAASVVNALPTTGADATDALAVAALLLAAGFSASLVARTLRRRNRRDPAMR